MRYPKKVSYRPDISVRKKIAAHLGTLFGRRADQLLPFIPEVMESWGKVRIKGKGDYMRTSCVKVNKTGRDQSYIKVR